MRSQKAERCRDKVFNCREAGVDTGSTPLISVTRRTPENVGDAGAGMRHELPGELRGEREVFVEVSGELRGGLVVAAPTVWSSAAALRERGNPNGLLKVAVKVKSFARAQCNTVRASGLVLWLRTRCSTGVGQTDTANRGRRRNAGCESC